MLAAAAAHAALDLPAVGDQTKTAVIYLDHNATSPLLPEARVAWLDAAEKFPGNPSSPHRLGARAEQALDDARARLAAVLDCAAHDIVWTSGATESCNAALHHAATAAVARDAADSTAPVWLSAIEHPAVLAAARHFFRERVQLIPVTRHGVVDLDWLATQLAAGRLRPALVAVMAANNETGVLQPWREAQALCAARGVAFFCDATQWCGRLPAHGLGAADFIAGSAHKFGGPRGVGFLKCPPGAAPRPLLHGGKQQEGRRAGTENLPGILATVAALEWCERQIIAGESARRHAVRDRFERELCAALPSVAINGLGPDAGVERLWNTVNVVMPESDCRVRWVVKLDKAGFAVSTGSACASGSEEPSHVLTAMGLAPSEAARVLRFSAGWLTPETAWDELCGALGRIHGELV